MPRFLVLSLVLPAVLACQEGKEEAPEQRGVADQPPAADERRGWPATAFGEFTATDPWAEHRWIVSRTGIAHLVRTPLEPPEEDLVREVTCSADLPVMDSRWSSVEVIFSCRDAESPEETLEGLAVAFDTAACTWHLMNADHPGDGGIAFTRDGCGEEGSGL